MAEIHRWRGPYDKMDGRGITLCLNHYAATFVFETRRSALTTLGKSEKIVMTEIVETRT